MCEAGLIEEVRELQNQGLRSAPTASRAIGYSQVLDFLSGGITESLMREKIVYATQKFARRQQRWFRQDPRIHWVRWDDKNLSDVVLSHFNEILSSQ